MEDEEDSGNRERLFSLILGEIMEIVHEGFHIYSLQMQSKKEKTDLINELKTLLKDSGRTWLVARQLVMISLF